MCVRNYQGRTQWLVGLFTHGANGGVYRASSGRAPQGLAVPGSLATTWSCVRFHTDNEEQRLLECSWSTLPFVCEKGPGE